MGTFYNDTSIEGDVYIQKLSSYIRKNEESLANGLLCFSKNRTTNIKTKPLRLSFTIHHLYFITEKIENSSLGVDVGPLNIKLDNPNHEPTFISFMANNARSSRHFDSDTRSISSINSMKSIVSSASIYWRSLTNINKDPRLIFKDLKYLYSSFTKIPCLILNPNTKVNSINGYEEYPCDTSIPIKMFKNLQVLELVEYEPNEIFGWNILSDQLRILIIRKSKINNMAELLFNLVIDDESGRISFNNNNNNNNTTTTYRQLKFLSADDSIPEINIPFKYKRDRGNTNSTINGGAGSLPKDFALEQKNYESLPDTKWSFLKQLTVSETNIITIPRFIFKPLINLVKLNLSNNLLEEVPQGLDQLINVKYLNFADNYITSLKNLPNNLNQLLTLNFNNNKLNDLTGLENLSNLEKIDLRKNNLKELKDLKPLILLFMKNSKLDNIYLTQNKLTKNYRIDLFNLFNGIRYKNNMKLDDSRPGYFEKAMLLDSDMAIKNLEKFLFESNNRRNSLLTVEIETNEETQITLISNGSSTTTKETLLEPFSNLKITDNQIQLPESPKSSSSNKFKKYDLSHTVISNSLALLSQPTSPLHANYNITNKDAPNTSPLNKQQQPMIHINNSNSSIPSTQSIKRSTTLVDFDKNNHAAPNILTPVQVTARMST